VRSCRTASVFALGVVAAVTAASACRDALTATIPPVTTADAATDAAAEGGADPPVAARLIDTPAKIEARVCARTLMAVVKGNVSALSESLGPGDVLVLESGEPFDATGSGTVVWAQTAAIASCAVGSHPAATKTVVRATAAPALSWASGTMTAHLDVEGPAPELYLGRLEGTAAVAERGRQGCGHRRRSLNAA
jgi:hypothetical protein